jgi:iron complex outermembrane receptor protein
MPALSYSVSVFHNEYDRLRTIEPQAGGAVISNRMGGMANGIQAWGSYRVSRDWRLVAGGTRLNQKLELEPGSASIGGVAAAGNDPTHTWQLRSSHDLTPRHEFDISVRHVGGLPNGPVPKYTAVDARLAWKASRAVELSLAALNLLDPAHPEWGAPGARAEIERSWFLKLLWRM